jgi:ABC-type lipoprotein release transport system permease subunit
MDFNLVLRSLRHYWRTNLAVVAGVAVAVTVLAGALLVGDSVRGSLRDLVLQRLGRTDLVVVSADFFRAALAEDVRTDAAFSGDFGAAAPIVALQGLATDQASGRRASRVMVYGIDDRFRRFHGDPGLPAFESGGAASRDVVLSPALAREIGAEPGSTVLVRVQRPSDIPLESLHGRKDDVGRTLRLTVRAIAVPAHLGEFSLQPQQGDVRAAFVPLARLQRDLDIGDRANALLISRTSDAPDPVARLSAILRRRASLADLGLRIRVLRDRGGLALESASAILDDARASAAAKAARDAGLGAEPIFTYLANTIRAGDREIPYSLVTAMELSSLTTGSAPPRADDARAAAGGPRPQPATGASARVVEAERQGSSAATPVVLNDWAARQLAVRPGDTVTMDYYVWEDPGRLATRSSPFAVTAIVPLAGAAADRDLAPEYPGITGSESLADWDPPFPLDLGRVRPVDEEYWREYRTTPKAFVPLAAGQQLWRSRYGALTSIRLAPAPGVSLDDALDRYSAILRAALDPIAAGLGVRDVRAEGLAASRGATDFGEYFAYFSFFLVVSALMLAALFFKLGVEQRAREIGLLRAVGFTGPQVRWLFTVEGVLLALAGCAIGAAGAVGYAYLMMTGLRTWWVGAVGTTALTLHVSAASLAAGAVGGVAAAVLCIWWTLRSLARVSERSLLAGEITALRSARETAQAGRGTLYTGLGMAAAGTAFIGAAAYGAVDRTGGFFGGGISLLIAWLSIMAFTLRQPSRATLSAVRAAPMWRLGIRNAGHRPGRTVLAVAVIASATFIVVAVDAFRRDEHASASGRRSGTGGYPLLVDTLLPIAQDPDSADGRALLGLGAGDPVRVTPFRVLPGDDASCLNLYAPQKPRVLGAPAAFLRDGRFAFQSSLDDAEANPWLLLERPAVDGAVPVAADANSLAYVLHKSLGDEIAFEHAGRSVRLRIVAALADSIFQGELLMSEANFLKLFPGEEGYRFLLVDAPADRVEQTLAAIEDRLADFGADAGSTAGRLAEFHRVENTYLSTFQTLGGLGLLLGTVGMAAVLLRNVLERRRELALLGAVGYGQRHVFRIVVAETILILVSGLAAGIVCALVAIVPAALERGGRLPTSAAAWILLFAVFATGVVASMAAARAAIQTRLVDALRAE